MVTRSRRLLAALAFLGTAGSADAASTRAAQSCHDPDALGTFRTVAVGGPVELGLKTYPRTLDLADREVVLTFDDGPSRATTPAVLEALAAQCVKATFFLIGRNAQAAPELVRREVAEGHTVGHHTWDHPSLTLRNMSAERGIEDILRGMQADDRAAGYGPWTGEPRVPFFRYPGFGSSAGTASWLREHSVAVFGADLWASDWVPMTPETELGLLMGRLRAAGGGIVLLHDIKRQTADMLPRLLRALKDEQFRVVHLVPGAAPPKLREAPLGWISETERTLDHMWPRARAEGPTRAKADLSPSINRVEPALRSGGEP